MMEMHDSAIYVWAILDQAKNNSHPYGKNSAEIYAQHLLQDGQQNNDSWLKAGRLLHDIIQQFCQANSAKAYIDGRLIGEWMYDYKFFHKCEVRIEC